MIDIGSGTVRVRDAHGAPPTIPFWLGVFQPEGLSDVVQSIVSLVLYILLPLVVGMVLRRFLTERSERWSRLAEGLGSVLIMIVIVAAILSGFISHFSFEVLAWPGSVRLTDSNVIPKSRNPLSKL